VFLVCVCNGTAGGFSGRFITKLDSFGSAVCTHIVRGYKRAASETPAPDRSEQHKPGHLLLPACQHGTRWSVRKKYSRRVPPVGPVKVLALVNERLLVTSGRAVDHGPEWARHYSASLRWEGVTPLTNHLKGSAAIVCWRLVVV
jgi:hypothetical protein